MVKPKPFDWRDSNMALVGTDADRTVKKESAEMEPAWKGAGKDVGLQIWRIVKFKVTHWDKDQYGEFFNGDSYIILNTYKEPEGDALNYDVHFWIGKYSTQDEYATAAYKTVELDTLLDDKPIQHREVQQHESNLFKSYFATITTLKGGADTGFNRVLPEVYIPRLIHVHKESVETRSGRNKTLMNCVQVSFKKSQLKSGDVFLIDTGSMIYQWNGEECSHDEKFRAAQEIQKMKSSRSKAKSAVLEEKSTSPDHPVLALLEGGDTHAKHEDVVAEKKIFRVSDADGSLDLEDVDGYSRGLLTSDDVYIVITGPHCYCWIGRGASIGERQNGLAYASNYLNNTKTPFLPISVIAEGKEPAEFENEVKF